MLLTHEFLLLVVEIAESSSQEERAELVESLVQFVVFQRHAVFVVSRCLVVGSLEDVGLAWVELALHAFDDHVADVGLHLSFQRFDDDTKVGVAAVTELVDVAHGVQYLLRRASHEITDAVEVV